MTTRKKSFSVFGAALLLGVAISFADAPVSHTTAILPITVKAGKTNYVGVPLTRIPADYGTITAITSTTVTDSSANYSALAGPLALQISSGANRGKTVEVTAVSGPNLTVAENLTALAELGTRFVLHQEWTLASLLGNPGSGGNPSGLRGASSAGSADQVVIFDPASGGSKTYYYKNGGAVGGIGWRELGDSGFADRNGIRVPLNDGIQIKRQGAQPDLVLDLQGTFRIGRQSKTIKAPATSPAHNGFNVVTWTNISTPVTLLNSGLYTGNPATGVRGGSSSGSADIIQVQNLATGDIVAYFYKNGGAVGGIGWRRVGDATFASQDGVSIPSGASIVIRRSTGAGDFTLNQDQAIQP